MNQHNRDTSRGRKDEELIDTGVENPDVDADDPAVDHLTREDVEDDPGEATRKLPKNDQAL
jgi:hypothetical protein